VSRLAIDPLTCTTLYAGTHGGGVFVYEESDVFAGDLDGDQDVDGLDLAEFAGGAALSLEEFARDFGQMTAL
jgi:hypothetical protein